MTNPSANNYHVSNRTLRLFFAVSMIPLAASCSKDVTGPTPNLETTAPGDNATVSPGVICREQLSSTLTLRGDGFSPVPFGIPDNPQLALPDVNLSAAWTIDGTAVSEPIVIQFSGNREAPKNSEQLGWIDQQTMSIDINQDLELDDLGTKGPLPRGVYDVTVVNPNGDQGEVVKVLAAVDAPSIDAIAPSITCLEQGSRTLQLTGKSFLRLEKDYPTLKSYTSQSDDTVTNDWTLDNLGNCTEVGHGTIDAELCESAELELAANSVPLGLHPLELINPTTASCSSQESQMIRVVPAPVLNKVQPPIACVEQSERSFVLEGSGFLRIDTTPPTVTVDGREFEVTEMGGCTNLETMGHTVESCDSVTVRVGAAELDPGVPTVVVENPGTAGCTATSSIALVVVPPPNVESVTPSLICLEEEQREILVAGTDFLSIDGVVPSIAFDGMTNTASITVATNDCSPLAVDGRMVEKCNELIVTIAANALMTGTPTITVTNPDPAGCSDTAADALRVVPAPQITRVEPTMMCVAQADRTLIIDGSDFLRLDTLPPLVTISGQTFDVIGMNNCVNLPTEGRAVESCTSMTVNIGAATLSDGPQTVSVENLDPAGCSATSTAAFTVVPPPMIVSVRPPLICVEDGQRTVVINGMNFLIVDGQVPSVDFDGRTVTSSSAIMANGCISLPINGHIVESCDQLMVSVDENILVTGTPTITIQNPAPAGCSDSASSQILVLPGPEVSRVEPELVCTDDTDRVLTLRGSNFIKINSGILPTVTLNGTQVTTSTATDCVPQPNILAGVNAQSCTTLELQVPRSTLAEGDVTVSVQNPFPAGCSVESSTILEVPPRLEITTVTPGGVCVNTPNDVQITIDGTGFLSVGSEDFTLTVGGQNITPDSVAACSSISVGQTQAESCNQVTATLPASLFTAEGPVPVAITSAAPSSCSVNAASSFIVSGQPTITSVTPDNVCSSNAFSLTLNGTNFTPTTVVSVGNSRPTVTFVSDTQLELFVFGGLAAGDYDISVSNGTACETTAVDALTIHPTPLVFFADPPVLYDGLAIDATIFTSGLAADAASVELVDSTGNTVSITGFSSPRRPNRITAPIPAGLPADTYDVTVRSQFGCSGTLEDGIQITDSLTLALESIDPGFASPTQATAVTIRASNPIPTGFEGFQSTPRAYLSASSSTAVAGATGLRSVVYVDEFTLTGIVPQGTPPGDYDLIVVNPTGAVGVINQAVTVTTVEPPIITDVAPGSLDNDQPQTAVVQGLNFDVSGGVRINMLCREPGATTIITQTATPNLGTLTANSVSATFPSDSFTAGTVCVVRLTNLTDNARFDYSAMSIKNPAQNLNDWSVAFPMNVPRRGLVTSPGRPTFTSRFLYAIGGDDTVTTTASVEASQVGIFGDLNPWEMQRNWLPSPRSFAGVHTVDRFVYVTGGFATGTATNTVLRSQILDPLATPEIVDIDLTLGVESGGVLGGLWFYSVSAVFDENDPSNPGGESLPGEILVVQLPSRGIGIALSLTWSPIPNAVGYRIYRSPAPNGSSDDLQLLTTITTTVTTYADVGTPTDPTQTPLPLGSLGVWHELENSPLNSPREGHTTLALPSTSTTSNDWHIYAFGGRDGVNHLNTYEYATITIAPDGQQTVSAWTTSANTMSTPRADLGSWSVTRRDSPIVPAGETWVYIGGGSTTSGNSSDVQAGQLTSSGDLSTLQTVDSMTPPRVGYGYGAANGFLFGFGGRQGNANTSGVSAELETPTPQLSNWNSLGISMNASRIYMGSAQESAFFFICGGENEVGAALNSCEQTVQ